MYSEQRRERARRLVAELRLPHPLTAIALHRHMEKIRGRKILIQEATPGLLEQGICGLWIDIAGENCERIYYAHTDSAVHRQQFINHEFGHMILQQKKQRVPAERIAQLAPLIPLDAIAYALARGRFTDEQEALAEAIGDRLALIMRRDAPAAAIGPQTGVSVASACLADISRQHRTVTQLSLGVVNFGCLGVLVYALISLAVGLGLTATVDTLATFVRNQRDRRLLWRITPLWARLLRDSPELSIEQHLGPLALLMVRDPGDHLYRRHVEIRDSLLLTPAQSVSLTEQSLIDQAEQQTRADVDSNDSTDINFTTSTSTSTSTSTTTER